MGELRRRTWNKGSTGLVSNTSVSSPILRRIYRKENSIFQVTLEEKRRNVTQHWQKSEKKQEKNSIIRDATDKDRGPRSPREAGDKFGVDISSHRSRSVNDVHIEDFDYIVPMADVVQEDLKESFPNLGEKLLPSWGIEDPYLGDLHTYEETAAKIHKHMEQLSVLLKNAKK